MNLQSERELEVTRDKLRLLEQRCEATQSERAADNHVQELTLRSLRRLINQLKEEIARFEGRAAVRTRKP